MFCSVVIPTVGRASLARAVFSVLEQLPAQQPAPAADPGAQPSAATVTFEVIVVNDSGQSLPPADWQQSPAVRVVETNRRERSFARNAGAAVARGQYLNFLDDDDWLAPSALQAFAALAATSAAGWLYGAAHLVDQARQVEQTLLMEADGNCFAQVLGGEWIPLQASLIRADHFFAIGGFNPLSTPGEDRDLCNRFALVGEFAHTRKVVAFLDRSSESTTNYTLSLRHSRREREKMLSEAGIIQRLRSSTGDPYWRSRAARVLAASAAWNLQQGRPLVALSRSGLAVRAVVDKPGMWVNADFWRGMTRGHASKVVDLAGLPEVR